MNIRIYKYPIGMADVQSILMPVGAEILTVQFQNGVLCLWAKVSIDSVQTTRRIFIVGTGNPFPDELVTNGRYIGTVQQSQFVWHVFEEVL